MIKTHRLQLVPLGYKALRDYTRCNKDKLPPDLKEALETQIIPAFETLGENWFYSTLWLVKLRYTGLEVGSICFKGAPVNGSVEIGYGIDQEHRNSGFCTEAVTGMLGWCAGRAEIKRVTALTLPDNTASQKVLKKCGFKQTMRVAFEDGHPVVEFEILV